MGKVSRAAASSSRRRGCDRRRRHTRRPGSPATRALRSASAGDRCSSRLQTAAPGVFAAGDICEYDSLLHGGPMRIEHWDVAFNHGKTAAAEHARRTWRIETVPYFFSVLANWASWSTSGPRSVGRGDRAGVAARMASSRTGTCRTAASSPRSRSGAQTTSITRAGCRRTSRRSMPQRGPRWPTSILTEDDGIPNWAWTDGHGCVDRLSRYVGRYCGAQGRHVIAARISGIAPTRGRGGAITAGRRSRRPRRGRGRSSSSGRLEGSMRRCEGWRCAVSLGISESSVSCSGWSKRRSLCCRMRSGVWSALRGLAPRSSRGWRRRCGAVDHGGRPAFARSLPRTRSFAAGSKMARSINGRW